MPFLTIMRYIIQKPNKFACMYSCIYVYKQYTYIHYFICEHSIAIPISKGNNAISDYAPYMQMNFIYGRLLDTSMFTIYRTH